MGFDDFVSFLDSVSWEVGSLIIVAFFVAFAIIGIIVVRKTITIKTLKSHHDVAGFIFSTLGVLYSVLLGFTVVNVQQRFDRIKNTTHLEAGLLNQLLRDSEVFSTKYSESIRTGIKNYTASIIHDEWPLMAKGNSSPKTEEALNKIWAIYYNADIEDKKELIWYTESIQKLNQLMNARLDRLTGREESLGREMWISLIFGGFLLISFIWFFGLESLTAHILMGSILAAATGFLLFLIYSLDTTFSGNVYVGPVAYENVLNTLRS